jgi:GTPase SAR1 family protein
MQKKSTPPAPLDNSVDSTNLIEKKNNQETEKKNRIILVGLPKAGKTSILLSLQGKRNLLSFVNIRPTIRIDRQQMKESDQNIIIWELGGQNSYRKANLDEAVRNFQGIKKIIFVIDVQDKENYSNALDYLKLIVDQIPQGFTPDFLVFLHKYDPEIENDPEFSELKIQQQLLVPIKKIVPVNLKLQFMKSTIFTVFKSVKFE